MRWLPLFVLACVGCASEPSSASPSDAGSTDAHVVDAHADARSDVRGADGETSADLPPPKVPDTLAETGLYADLASKTLAEGVLPYEVRWPLWSDGADKARYLYVPAGKTIDTTDMDHWVFPMGTKAWKEFRVGGKLVETRYLEKTGEGSLGWRYASYLWTADGTSAKAVPAGAPNALGTTHDVPDQDACENCHSGTRDGLIGLGAIQLGKLDVLGARLDKPSSVEHVVPGAGDVQQVLGYLHGNCGYCHGDVGRWSAVRPMRLHVPVGLADPTKSPVYTTAIGKPMAHTNLGPVGVQPKDPAQSQLWNRIKERNLTSMPPVGTEVVDDAAVALIKRWIESL